MALIDLGLPGFEGYERARRAREAGPRTRLVALTGYGLPDDRHRSRQAGFDAHLMKPVDSAQLAALIRAAKPVESPPRWGRSPAMRIATAAHAERAQDHPEAQTGADRGKEEGFASEDW